METVHACGDGDQPESYGQPFHLRVRLRKFVCAGYSFRQLFAFVYEDVADRRQTQGEYSGPEQSGEYW
jgi:hypothetical protein